MRNNSLIRDLNKKDKSIKKTILSSMIVFCFLVFVFFIFSNFKDKKIEDEGGWSSGDVEKYIVGTDIIIKGKIEKSDKSEYFDIILESDKQYGLNSKDINLKTFIGESVEIEGKTEGFVKDLPIINVNTIKISDKNIIINKNNYTLTDYLIIFNFSKQPELSANKDDSNSIKIIYDGQEFNNVEIFSCNKVDKVKDCESLAMSYKYSNKDNFISYFGHTFYRYSNNSWIVFNDERFGYIFQNIDDQTMLDLSSTIQIINKEFVLTQKKSLISQDCQTNNENMKEIEEMFMEIEDEKILKVSINGETNKKRQAICHINFDLRNKRNVDKIILEFK